MYSCLELGTVQLGKQSLVVYNVVVLSLCNLEKKLLVYISTPHCIFYLKVRLIRVYAREKLANISVLALNINKVTSNFLTLQMIVHLNYFFYFFKVIKTPIS
jgi:hypothetical protein